MRFYDVLKVIVTISAVTILVGCVAASSSHAVSPPKREVYLTGGSSPVATVDGSSGYVCSVENLRTDQVFHAEAAQRNNALKQVRSLCLSGQFARSCSVKFYCSPM